jgi:type III restriction enzyme
VARQVVIENPVLNSPYREPARHFRFDDDGITNEIVAVRRPSSYIVSIAAARKRGGQLAIQTEWTADVEENAFINQVRERVGRWRQGGWPHVTPTTRRLLEYWTNPERERPLAQQGFLVTLVVASN